MSATIIPYQASTTEKDVNLNRLRITEIFSSIQGESTFVGLPTTFIRLTGCPLRCQYCDTAYAFNGGEWISFDDVVASVNNFQNKYITVTGGEPLAQKNCVSFLTKLCDLDYIVSLETSGALDISAVDPRVIKVMDIKTPASDEADKNLWENIQFLQNKDQVKFVICNHADYEWAKEIVEEHKLAIRCEVLFSPSSEQISPKQLAEWILSDHLNVRFQLQLHKLIWGNVPGK